MSQTQSPSLPPFSFEGLKFFVSILVPERIKKLIKSHNGIITPREVEADAIILDPKRNARSTGISYAWIEECIRAGSRLDEERFRVEPTTEAETARKESAIRSISAASRAQAKPLSRRNVFTPEDDRILIDWLRAQQALANREHRLLRINGNKIYAELEAEHPQHTFHSWRDRWVRHLAPSVTLEHQEDQERSSTPAAPSPTRRRQEARRRAAQNTAPAEERDDGNAVVEAAPKTGTSADNEAPAVDGSDEEQQEQDPQPQMFFMREEHYYIMRRTHRHKIQAAKTGEAQSEADFFQSLHDEHSSLSATEWRETYNELKDWYKKAFPGNSRNEATPSTSAGHIEAPELDDGVNSTQVDVPTAPTEFEEPEAGEEMAEDPGDDMNLDDDAILDSNDSHIEEQQLFLSRLEKYNKFASPPIPTSFPVNDRMMETFSLWKAIQEQDAESVENINWSIIARSLGYSDTDYPGVDKLLADRYMTIKLAGFQALLDGFNKKIDDGEDDGEDDGNDEGDGTDDDEQESEGEDVPTGDILPSQQWGILSSVKRRVSDVFSSKSPAVNGDALASSPSKRVRFTEKNTSEAHEDNDDNDDDDGGDDEDNEDDEDNDDDEFESHSQPVTLQAAGEPETQDFAYDPDTQHVDMSDVEDDDEEDAGPSAVEPSLTPSQQLQAEQFLSSSPRASSGRVTRSKTPTASQTAVPRATTTPRQTRTRAGGSRRGQQGN